MNYRLYVAAFALISTACAKKTENRPDADLARANARYVAMDQIAKNFERVYFEFDSAILTKDSRDALADNVQIMNRFPELVVEVEGHCDDRGSVEYNLALGERRAFAIKRYMVTAGLPEDRISTISYGEERPLLIGDNGPAHQMNRRAEFRLTVEEPNVKGSVADADDEADLLDITLADR
jgi:peptidoglycan-associated lipoprotein